MAEFSEFEAYKYGNWFKQEVKNQMPVAYHTASQLDHVEMQLGKSQAGLSGESDVQTFTFMAKDPRKIMQQEFPVQQAIDRRFVDGMVQIAKYLRRELPQ